MDNYNDYEEYEKQMQEEFEKYRQAASDWKKKWPNHCNLCNGWGGHVYYENHGLPGMGEQLFDPCECQLKENIHDILCPRCGQKGLTIDEENDEIDIDKECTECGWNYDDGLPEF